MNFTYYPPTIPVSEIDPGQLQHRYFVQLAPDGNHLVPGQLQQDINPTIGQWLEVGHITRDLPARYFVQTTDFSTLVPGSVIQADRFPQGNWKEIKKPSFGRFHRVVFNPDFIISVHNDHDNDTYVAAATTVVYFTMQVLNFLLPGVYTSTNPATLQLYYFIGTFADFNNDVSKLTVFAAPGSNFRLYDAVHNTNTSFVITNKAYSGFDYVMAIPTTPDGYSSLVVRVPANGTTPEFYIFMENIFNRYEFPYD